MELDYLLATLIFLSVCVYVAVETVDLYSSYSGNMELYKKEYLTYYNSLKYNFSNLKGNLIYNFKLKNISYIMKGWIFKNDSNGKNLVEELINSTNDSANSSNSNYIVAYIPSKNEYVVSNNKQFLKLIGKYNNISAVYEQKEYNYNDFKIIYPNNYTIKYRNFTHVPYNKLFETPFCIVDRGNITIKYCGILGVGR